MLGFGEAVLRPSSCVRQLGVGARRWYVDLPNLISVVPPQRSGFPGQRPPLSLHVIVSGRQNLHTHLLRKSLTFLRQALTVCGRWFCLTCC